jgi:hypothetical protein
MKLTFRVLSALTAAVISTLVSAPVGQAQVTLRWKFQPDTRQTFDMVQETTAVPNVNGADATSTTKQTMSLTWHVKSVNDKGDAVIEQIIDRIQFRTRIPGVGDVEYDSKANKLLTGAKDPLPVQSGNSILAAITPTFDGLIGAPITFTASPLGKISDVQFPDKLLAAFKNSPIPGNDRGAEEMFKQMFNQSGAMLPEAPVNVGTKWNQSNSLQMPFGQMKLNMTFTYLGTEVRNGGTVEKIGATPTISLVANPNSPIKLTIADSEVTSLLYFDNAAGQLIESNLEMTLKMVINDTIKQTISQKMSMTAFAR